MTTKANSVMAKVIDLVIDDEGYGGDEVIGDDEAN